MDKPPKAPPGLSPEGQRYWRNINKAYVLDDDALEVLRVACVALSRHYEAGAIIKKSGLLYKCGSTVRQSPAVQVELKSRKQFLDAVKQLNFTDPEDKKPLGRPPEGGNF